MLRTTGAALRRAAWRRARDPPPSRALGRALATAQDRMVYSEGEVPVVLDSSQHVVGYLSRVLNARVYDACIETPLQDAPNLSKYLGHDVKMKREDLQPVFSFKLRGAYNKMVSLTQVQKDRGVVACSAGNHAQGVALSAKMLGLHATIVMPVATPNIKVANVKRLGADNVTIVLQGDTFDEASAECSRLCEDGGLTLIHPYDDPDVIAGQGTIGMEILKTLTGQPLDVVFCCVGGGGLLAGVSAYIKRVRPSVLLIGVEMDDAAGMTASLAAGKVVTLDHVGLFADGAAVRTVGTETYRVASELCDGMITVTTDELCAAIKHGFNDTRTVLEPAGALAIAGATKWAQKGLGSLAWRSPKAVWPADFETGTDVGQTRRQSLVAVASGANVDFNRLRFVTEHADVSETLLAVRMPERRGAMSDFYDLMGERNVTEFSYRMSSYPQNGAQVIVSVQCGRDASSSEHLIASLETDEFEVTDLSNNDFAKVHLRHMAGGRAPGIRNERLVRFEFPERPGALKTFLETMRRFQVFNISLWHYRNHGDDFGRVLVGMQVSPRDDEKFQSFLDELNYKYVDETDNVAYGDFLL